MTPSLKKLCIFGLASGIGQMIQTQVDGFSDMTPDEKEIARWNAVELHKSGMSAISNCKVKIDSSKIRQASKRIDQVCKNKKLFDVTEMLSFLFMGLNDLAYYCKENEIIKQVEDAALNFITLFDPNLEDESIHAAALDKYERWIR